MEHIKVMIVDWLPHGVPGLTTYCFDDGWECFTVFLNGKLTNEKLISAYKHELKHIDCRDFSKLHNVNELEKRRHA